MRIPVNPLALTPSEQHTMVALVEHGPDYPWFDDSERAEEDRFGLVSIRLGQVGLHAVVGTKGFEPYMLDEPAYTDEPFIQVRLGRNSHCALAEIVSLYWPEGSLKPSDSDVLHRSRRAAVDIIQAHSNLGAAQSVARAGNVLALAVDKVRMGDNQSITASQLTQGGIEINTLVKALIAENIASLGLAEEALIQMGVSVTDIYGIGHFNLPGVTKWLADANRIALAKNDRIASLIEA